jgi:hypothetical protein
MATQQEPQAKPASLRKYESFVEQQLARASGRVRGLDLAGAGLVFLIGILFYVLAVVVADLCLDLAPRVRLAAFAAYGFAAALYLGVVLTLFVRRRVNPYYAARQLERTLPDAKGSVINWLDLHERPLPQAIRASLGARAAKDLTRADVDEAISSRRNLWLACVTGGLVVGLLVVFLTGPGRFGSLLARTFAPFTETEIPTQTELFLLQPEQGNLTVPVNQKVTFRVAVRGRVPRVNQPDSVRLLYRYNLADTYAERPLDVDPHDEWTTTLLPDQVQNGFWYKIAGGDVETPEYQVTVRSIPQVAHFDVQYHYRPYLRQPDRHDRYPNERAVFPHIKDYKGTEVTLTLKTNRSLAQGRLELEQAGDKRELACQVLPDDREAMRCKFRLDRPGTFRVHFESREGESNTDRSPYQIEVIDDNAPLVELTKPGKDINLPANGTLQLDGSATDDVGIKQMTLRLRVISKGLAQPELASKVYREGKSFQLAGGKYPDFLSYKDFVALDGIKTAKGPLAAGMELEYWLEAVDNSDYPEPAGNVGRSKKYRVAIGAPEQDKQKQEEQRAQAKQEQQKHEKRQDQDLARKNQELEAEQRAQEDAAKAQDPAHQKKREEQKKDFENRADQVNNALNEQKKKEEKQQDNQRGQAKGAQAEQPKGAAKEKGPEQQGAGKEGPKQQQPAGKEGAGEKKGEGDKGQGAQHGQAKDAGQAGEPKEQQGPGGANDGGAQQPQAQAKGTKENNTGGKEEGQCACKGGQGQQQSSAAKAGGQGNAQASQNKGGHQGGGGGAQQAQAQAKGQDQGPAQGMEKQGGGAQHQAAAAKAKEGGGPNGQGQAQAKQAPAAGRAPAQARGGPQSSREPTGDDLANLEKKLQREQQAQEDALNELSRLAKEAKDPRVREAARQALKEAQARGQQPGPGQANDNPQPGKEPSAADVARMNDQLRRDQQELEDTLDELSRLAKEHKDPKVRKQAEDALKWAREQQRREAGQAKDGKGDDKVARGQPKGQGEPDQAGNPPPAGQARDQEGHEGAPAKGEPDDGKKEGDPRGQAKQGRWQQGTLGGQRANSTEDQPPPWQVDAAAARRAGELYLEELRSKLTPDVLKKLNWTQKDVDQFMKDARAYQEAQRRQPRTPGKDKLSGGTSLLPGQGLRQVGQGPNRLTDPLESLHVLPPPEFSDAHRRFTSSPPGSK